MASVNEFVSKNPLVGYITLGAPLLLGLYLIYTRVTASPYAGPSSAYFYNLETQELIVLPNDSISPEDLGGGEIAVRALVYSCSDCSDETRRSIAYLTKHSEQARSLKLEYPKAGSMPADKAFKLMESDAVTIASVEDALNDKWDSIRGSSLPDSVTRACPEGQKVLFCIP